MSSLIGVAVVGSHWPEKLERVLNAWLASDRTGYAEPVLFLDGAQDSNKEANLACVDLAKRLSLKMDQPETHLGMRSNSLRAIYQILARYESIVFLEDDTVPSVDFAPFCREILERYADDQRVMEIRGYNHHEEYSGSSASYFFSQGGGGPWGFGTWRRAWQHYPQSWEEAKVMVDLFKEKRIGKAIFGREGFDQEYWDFRFAECLQIPYTWDHFWTLAKWLQNGLAIVPKVNLVTNIGSNGTPCGPVAETPVLPLDFPLTHPKWMRAERAYDIRDQRLYWNPDWLSYYEKYKLSYDQTHAVNKPFFYTIKPPEE